MRVTSLAPAAGIIAAVALLMLWGCVPVPREAGFPDVQALVSERGVPRIHWNQNTAADQSVDDAVRQMLARELTADQAVQIALLNNPGLQAIYEDLSVAQADLVQAGLLKNPIFSGEFRIHEGTGDLAFEGSLVQNFVDLFLIPLRKRVAEAEFQATKLRVAGQVMDLAARVRADFYSLQARYQLLDIRHTVLEAMAASFEVARRLRQAGNITELDLAAQQAQYEQARVDFADAQAAALADRERMNALMGLWGKQIGWKIAARLPDPPTQELALEDAEKQAIARSLDLGVQREQILIAARQLGLAQPLALLNDAELGASAEHDRETGWAIGPAVALPVPLFDQGQARVYKAQGELRRARQLYRAGAIEIRAEARASAIRLRAARERVDYYRNVILPLKQKLLHESQLQYNAMQLGVFRLLDARQQQVEAGAQYVEALRKYWLARSELGQIMSGRLPRSRAASSAEDVPRRQNSNRSDRGD